MNIIKTAIYSAALVTFLTSCNKPTINKFDNNCDRFIDEIIVKDKKHFKKEIDSNNDFIFDLRYFNTNSKTYKVIYPDINAKDAFQEETYHNITSLIKKYDELSSKPNKNFKHSLKRELKDENKDQVMDGLKITGKKKEKELTLLELIDKNLDGKFEEIWVRDIEHENIRYHISIKKESIEVETYFRNSLMQTKTLLPKITEDKYKK